MNIWMNLVLGVQLLAAIVIIGLVLIQHGKGADMGASFGSGASGSLFGATGSANFLSRTTAVAAAVFFISTLAMAYFGTNNTTRSPTGTSVLERAAAASGAASGASGVMSGASGVANIPTGMIPTAPSATTPAVAPTTVPAGSAPAVPAAPGVIPK